MKADIHPKYHNVVFQDLSRWRRLQEELRMKDRMAAVGELAAGLAHEIGNPLAAISGSVQMLSSSLKGDPAQRKLLAYDAQGNIVNPQYRLATPGSAVRGGRMNCTTGAGCTRLPATRRSEASPDAVTRSKPPSFISATISSDVFAVLTLTLQPDACSNLVTQSNFGSVSPRSI